MKVLPPQGVRRFRVCVVLTVVIFFSCVCEAKHRNWTEVRSAHFLLVTNAGEKQGRKAVTQFERIRAFFRQSLAVASQRPSPFVVVLAAKDEPTMQELIHQHWAQGQPHAAGVFSHPLDQYFAAVELDVQRSGQFAVFYHEYYHSITAPEFPDLPTWLAEGLAEFYGRTDIEDNSVGTGRPDRDWLDLLKQKPLIPLNVLLKVDKTSPYYNDPNKAPLFYAESWVLTHYLMIGNHDAHERLVNYLEALSHRKSWNEAVNAFGDLNKLQSELSAYAHQKKFLYVNAPAPRIESDEPKIRCLSEAEVEAYLGAFSAAVGHTRQAVQTLTEAVRLDANSSLANEYLGMAEFLDGQKDKALESASRAVQLDPNNASARYLLASYVTYGSGILTTNAPVEENLRQAIALSPEFVPSSALLGLYLGLRTSRQEEALSLLTKTLSLDPSNSTYQLSYARVLLKMNKYKEAVAAASRANVLARDSAEKTNVREFNSLLEQEHQKN